MNTHNLSTVGIIKIIGSPFLGEDRSNPSDDQLLEMYPQAFADRVAPLYLHLYRHTGWDDRLESFYQTLKAREDMTRTVLVDLAKNLNEILPNGYVIMKSIKPYPAIPNDTDVLILGGKKEFKQALNHLYGLGYVFHEWAPMQTTLYDPRGKGKIGKGKKGGTYYIDIYQDISTDYVCYLDKSKLKPFIYSQKVDEVPVNLLVPEVELAIILFHNLFPERTFQLEHFYMPLYYLCKEEFNINVFIRFIRENHMEFAIRANISLIKKLHEYCFKKTPEILNNLTESIGENKKEISSFVNSGLNTPYMFTKKSFILTMVHKLSDFAFIKSIFIQAFHMLNPIFFVDVIKSLMARFSEKGTYHLE